MRYFVVSMILAGTPALIEIERGILAYSLPRLFIFSHLPKTLENMLTKSFFRDFLPAFAFGQNFYSCIKNELATFYDRFSFR
jgi:hypothetical protein